MGHLTCSTLSGTWPTKIRIGSKCFTVSSTLAYFRKDEIKAKKVLSNWSFLTGNLIFHWKGYFWNIFGRVLHFTVLLIFWHGLTGQNTSRVFNSRCGRARLCRTITLVTKTAQLKVENLDRTNIFWVTSHQLSCSPLWTTLPVAI